MNKICGLFLMFFGRVMIVLSLLAALVGGCTISFFSLIQVPNQTENFYMLLWLLCPIFLGAGLELIGLKLISKKDNYEFEDTEEK